MISPANQSDGIPTPPTGRWRPRVWATAVPILVLAALAWLWSGHGSQSQPVRLPDGTVLTWVSVQGGPRHFNPFQPFVRRWTVLLPEPWDRRLDLQEADFTEARWKSDSSSAGRKDCLSLWFIYTNRGTIPGLVAWVEDGSGWSSDATAVTPRGTDHDGRWIEFCLLEDVPRGTDWLTVVLSLGTRPGAARSTFRIRDPRPTPSRPRFSSLPVPTNVADGGLGFTLERLSVGPVSRRSVPVRPRAQATVLVTEGGRPSPNWIPAQVALVEVAGGGIDATEKWEDEPRRRFDSPRREFDFPALPWNEPWRMRVGFLRVGGFETNEVWRVRGIPIQANSSLSAVNSGAPLAQTVLGGIPIRIVSLEDHHFAHARPDAPPPRGKRVVLWTDSGFRTGVDDLRIVVLRATDDQGRDSEFSNGNVAANLFNFLVAPGAKTLDFELAVSRMRWATFTAQPAVEWEP